MPQAKAVFGFEKETMSDEEFFTSRRFLAHGKYFVEILDKAIGMLGPDLEMLTEILIELGETHRTKYGVKPEYFPVLGGALLPILEKMLGPEVFTEHTKTCWLELYGNLTADMMRVNGHIMG